MSAARIFLSVLCATLFACAEKDLPPLGEIVLAIDTDAIVPARPGAADDETRAPALFDRLRIEIVRQGDGQSTPLAGQTREVSIDEGMFAERRVSVGILPPPGDAALLARIRLFRSDRVVGDQPAVSSTLDTTVELPPVGVEGKTELYVVLHTDDVGKQPGRPNPIAPSVGRGPASLVGTWKGGRRVLCEDAPRPDEVCVPGGAYWYGDPALRGRTRENEFVDERLVVLSPFFLDRTEVTVAAFRAAWPALKLQGADSPLVWTGRRVDEAVTEDWCTFSEAELSPVVSALPINCIAWETARAYCNALGKDLPTEAQYEYVMSGLGDESNYPWGSDEPSCTEAVWGRGGAGIVKDNASECRRPGSLGWMDWPGTGARDRIGRAILRNGTPDEIVDLGGNVSEWALDPWTEAGQGFWATTEPRVDPLPDAPTPGAEDARPIRGSSWLLSAVSARAAHRLRNGPAIRYLLGAGFRCARRASPRGGG